MATLPQPKRQQPVNERYSSSQCMGHAQTCTQPCMGQGQHSVLSPWSLPSGVLLAPWLLAHGTWPCLHPWAACNGGCRAPQGLTYPLQGAQLTNCFPPSQVQLSSKWPAANKAIHPSAGRWPDTPKHSLPRAFPLPEAAPGGSCFLTHVCKTTGEFL